MTEPRKPKSTASADLASLFELARGPERIAKRLARAGLCSRRDAERWIAAGRVVVDGTLLDSPAVTVTDASRIVVDGKPLPVVEPPRLWRHNKERGTVTTARDPEGRKTVFAALPDDLPRVISVGRLDVDSEGLLLLTNDGALARHLELPATGWTRRYRVRVFGPLDEAAFARLKRGVEIDGVRYGPIEVNIDKASRTNSWLTVALKEGKNREIRRVMEHLGLSVSRLLRVAYGPFQLGDIPPGGVEEVKTRVLKNQLGLDTGDETGRAKAKPKRTGTRPPPSKAPPKNATPEKAGSKGTGPKGTGPKGTGPKNKPSKPQEKSGADRRRKAPGR
jgi:23S rRNA pseudouridine2605 synthase